MTGLAAAVAARIFFSPRHMLIPAMALMIFVFLAFRKKFESAERRQE